MYTTSHAQLDFGFPVGLSAPAVRPEIITHLASTTAFRNPVVAASNHQSVSTTSLRLVRLPSSHLYQGLRDG